MARAGFLFLLMKRVFFCGVLPSKYSGRWRGCPQFDFAKEKRNFYPVASLLCFGAPQTPLPLFLFSNGTGTASTSGQKILPCRVAKRLLRGVPPNPLPFCPPAWASPSKLSDGRIFRRTDSFPCPTTRARKSLRNSLVKFGKIKYRNTVIAIGYFIMLYINNSILIQVCQQRTK